MPRRMHKLYFAGPLFTQAEWRWNAELAAALRKLGYKVFLPQERAWPMLNGREEFNPPTLFSENIDAISQADVVLAVLDGCRLRLGYVLGVRLCLWAGPASNWPKNGHSQGGRRAATRR